MVQCVITDSDANITPTDDDQALMPCPVCGEPFKKKVPWQESCSDKCRIKAFRLRQAAKIADEVRERVYEILAEKMVK
jgi:predicted nucleic acid-binding Zn ribbon protein